MGFCSNVECPLYSAAYEPDLIQFLEKKTCSLCEEKLREAQLPVSLDPLIPRKHQFLAYWLRRGLVKFEWEDLMAFNMKDAILIKIIIEETDRAENEAQRKAMKD